MMLADRYRLDMPLGHGRMGEVWSGLDERLNRPVAVKLLTETAVGDDRSTARFRKEARAATRLNHPRIVTVYDFGVSGGRCFVTMELVNGASLAHELRRRGRLGPHRVATLAAQAADALAEAHRQGVVHRDVKPANLLLDEEGMVKVADFGVAHLSDTQETRHNTGARAQLAPEATHGGKSGKPADIYALGCTLFELLTGEPPFGNDDSVAAPGRPEKTPVSPCRLCPGLPDAFGEFVLRMLAERPKDRPDAQEVADWFGKAAGRTATGTADAVIGSEAAPPERKTTGGQAIPTGAGPGGKTVVAPAPTDAGSGPTRGSRRGPALAGAVTAAAALATAAVVLTTPLTDGSPHNNAPGTGTRPTASGPTAGPGAGVRGPGGHPGVGQASAGPRSMPTSPLSDPAATGKATPVGLPGTATKPSREPTTGPTRTPSPTATSPSTSPSAPSSPSSPPSSPSPTPSGTASGATTSTSETAHVAAQRN